MEIKYSILIPYYDRHLQFLNTLHSFMQYVERKDFELIVVEDHKNTEDKCAHEMLVKVLGLYENKFPIFHLRYPKNIYNPAPMYNMAAKVAKGRYFIITSPECYHDTDVLWALDQQFEHTPDGYVVCACRATDMAGAFLRWYQHSEYKDSRYHFCSAISKANWKKIGGFDARYGEGYCFDDDDFRDTIIKAGIPIIRDDESVVTHQWHSKTYRPPNHKRLWEKNKALYISKFGKYEAHL